jgi:triosephosphate isomerase
MSRKLLAANWKMHLSLEAAQGLCSEVLGKYESQPQVQVPLVLAVPFPYLHACYHLTKHNAKVHIAAQNIHQEAQGAYTGETSGEMITSCGVRYVLVGHSERRQYFGETNALLASKLTRALAAGLRPIYCVGETLAEREAGQTAAVVEKQMHEGAFHLSEGDFGKLAIAYEPVWAIGTGKTATPDQAQEVHQAIRNQVAIQYGLPVADACTILYGGSVKGNNAIELFSRPDIDGGLVGGASLNSREFGEIMAAFAA